MFTPYKLPRIGNHNSNSNFSFLEYTIKKPDRQGDNLSHLPHRAQNILKLWKSSIRYIKPRIWSSKAERAAFAPSPIAIVICL